MGVSEWMFLDSGNIFLITHSNHRVCLRWKKFPNFWENLSAFIFDHPHSCHPLTKAERFCREFFSTLNRPCIECVIRKKNSVIHWIEDVSKDLKNQNNNQNKIKSFTETCKMNKSMLVRVSCKKAYGKKAFGVLIITFLPCFFFVRLDTWSMDSTWRVAWLRTLHDGGRPGEYVGQCRLCRYGRQNYCSSSHPGDR